MFFGHINNIHLNRYPKAIQFALEYIKNTDFDSLEVGRYALKGDQIYVQVLDLETKPKEEFFPEVHRNYIDVQYLHSGTEIMAFAPDFGTNPVAQGYNPERDILYYQSAVLENEVLCEKGNFAVFFPEDVHRAGILVPNSTNKIRKIVVKIAVTEL